MLTDEQNIEPHRKDLLNLSYKNDIFFINILDYFEQNLVQTKNIFSFTNAKNLLQFSFNNRKKIEEYQQIREQKQKTLKQFFVS